MEIIITEGTQFDDRYDELVRHKIKVDSENSIGETLKIVKELPLHILNQPYSASIIDHLYLMHPETRERLDENKTLADYNIQDGGILRIMSGVR